MPHDPQVPAILMIVDPAMCLTWVGGAEAPPIAPEPDPLCGRPVLDVLNDANRPAAKEAFRQALAGTPASFNATWEGRSFQFRLKPLRGPQGRITGVAAAGIEISDRPSPVGEAREWRDRYEAAARASGIILYDRDARTRWAVHGGDPERTLGWMRSEIDGNLDRYVDLVHPDDRAHFEEAWSKSVRDGLPTRLEYRLRRQDGAYLQIREDGFPICGPGGEVQRIVGFAKDVTSTRRLEEQLAQSQRIESVGRLAGGIAHDFNNLLTSILGYAELMLLKIPPGGPFRPEVEEIRSAGARAAELTRQLLAFGRKQVLQPRVIDLNAVVNRVHRLLRPSISANVEIVPDLAPDLGHVRADPAKMEQLLVNLGVNARDAMPRGGRLVIRTRNRVVPPGRDSSVPWADPGSYVELSVADTGEGMTSEVREHLFEPFFTTKEPGKGSGLGLPQVYGMVKQSGGFITVESSPGRGARFEILLPRVDDPVEPDTQRIPKALLLSKGETILLAEDDLAVRELAGQVLRVAGYQVLQAKNGKEALQVARQHAGPIHLLLTDVVMPELGGADLAKVLVGERPDTRVVFMTGYAPDLLRQMEGLDHDSVVLEKPFPPEALATRIRQVLDRPAKA